MTLNIFHLWAEHVVQPSEGPLEGDPSEEEDGEDHVGEDGCHVHHVARRGNTPENTRWSGPRRGRWLSHLPRSQTRRYPEHIG